jgi:hypothetical protein
MREIDKGPCRQCGHKIQLSLHNTCMYCGAELPADQQFTRDEINAMLAEHDSRQDDNSPLAKYIREEAFWRTLRH